MAEHGKSRKALFLLLALAALGCVIFLQQWRASLESARAAAELQRRDREAAAAVAATVIPKVPIAEPLVAGVEFDPPERTGMNRSQEIVDALLTEASASESTFTAAFGPPGADLGQLQFPPAARLHKLFLEELRQYSSREVDWYRDRTDDRVEIRELAERFLNECAEQGFGSASTDEQQERVLQSGVEALAAGSNDALVRCRYFERLGSLHPKYSVTSAGLNLILDRERVGRYPPLVEVRLRGMDSGGIRQSGIEGLNQRRNAFHQAVIRWLREESQQPENARVTNALLESLLSYPLANSWEILVRAAADGGVDRWLLHMHAGRTHRRMAWDVRGGGYASKVADEAWGPFRERLEKARIHFQHAWQLRPDRPEAAAYLVDIAKAHRADNGATTTDWLNKAIAAELDHPQAYLFYEDSLLSRWGGGPERMIEFAERCLATDRFDSTVPDAVPRLVADLIDLEGISTTDMFTEHPRVEALVAKFLTRQDESYAGNGNGKSLDFQPGHRELLVRLLYRSERRELAGQFARTVNPERPLRWFSRAGRPAEYDWTRVVAGGRANDKELDSLHAELALAPLDPLEDAAVAALRERIAVLRRDVEQRGEAPETLPLLAAYDDLLTQRVQWQRGEWIEFPADAMSLTRVDCADETRLLENGQLRELVGLGKASAQMGTGFLAPFPLPLEVEVRMEADQISKDLQAIGFQWTAGVGVGRKTDAESGTEILQAEATRPYFGYSNGFVPELLFVFPGTSQSQRIEVPRLASLPVYRLALWRDYYEFDVAGHVYSARLEVETDPAGRLWIGEPYANLEGSYLDAPTVGRIRMGNIRIRRLTAPQPPAGDASYTDRVAYWTSRSESTPTDYSAARQLAWLLLESDPQASLTVCDKLRRDQPNLNRLDLTQARALVQLGRIEEAWPMLRSAMRQDDGDKLAYIEAKKLVLKSAGPTADKLTELRRESDRLFDPDSRTWEEEYLALESLARVDLYRDQPATEFHAIRDSVTHTLEHFRNAIASAPPGPRRDRLQATLDKEKEPLLELQAKSRDLWDRTMMNKGTPGQSKRP